MKQITIIADDKVGLLSDISYILAKAKINIDALSVEANSGKAVINLTIRDYVKATQLLSANGYRVLDSEIIVIKVKDEPGSLSEVSNKLRDEGISIESLYLLSRGDGISLDALKVDKPKKALRVLSQYLMTNE